MLDLLHCGLAFFYRAGIAVLLPGHNVLPAVSINLGVLLRKRLIGLFSMCGDLTGKVVVTKAGGGFGIVSETRKKSSY